MLKHLIIKNYALISHLEMAPSGNLNVITGETGAGKSIMLGAMGLLMGNRADTKVLWDEQDKCITEGVFDISSYKLKNFFKSEDLDYDDQTVIRREISPGGKSRAFINDTPVTLDVLRKLGNQLMDIHSQHETLLLGNQAFQLKLIDSYAQTDSLLTEYRQFWGAYNQTKKSFESLEEQAESLRQEADYVNFQLDELLKANLENGEQENLESELKVMENAEDIKLRFNAILETLSRAEFSTRTGLVDAKNQIQPFISYSPNYENLYNRLNSLIIELGDVVKEIENEEERIEYDSERINQIKERIDLLYRLLKKHRFNSVSELLTLQEELQHKASLTANLDEELTKAREAYETSLKELHTSAEKLSKARLKIFTPLSKEIITLLKELGIPEAVLTIQHNPTEPTVNGTDRVEILFSANKGIDPKSIEQVASGGEFSRLMFCIKYVMARKTDMPTLVLDEIDSGVSGEIAIKLGKLMKTMAGNHQVISISHLPQIAAKADKHYFVYKDNSSSKTITNIKELSNEERIKEIAKMIGGDKPTPVAFENARELMV